MPEDKNPLAGLQEQGTALLADIEALQGKALEAKSDEDKVVAQEAVKAKEAEWEALKGKMEAAKIRAKRIALLNEVADLRTVVPAGSLAEGKKMVPVGRNVEDPVQGHTDAFIKYVQGKNLSDRELELTRPKSDSFEKGADGVVLPRHMTRAILGKNYCQALDRIEGKVLNSTSDSALVPQEYVPQLLQLPGEPATILDWVTMVPCKTGTLTIPRLTQTDANAYGGVAFTWITEGASKPETEPTFSQETIDTYELAGYTEVTHRMLSRSAFDIQSLLTTLYSDAMRNELARVIISGSGVGQPNGVVGFAGVRTVARAVANQVAYADLRNLKHLLLSYHRSGARWATDDTVEAYLEGLVDTTNRPLFNASVATGLVDRLLGYPYLVQERTPNIGASGDVVFGNWRYYWFVVEQEIVIKRSDHYKFQTNTAAFVAYCVVGGEPIQPRAFAYLVGPGS